ncbi:MAG TPA: peptidoglycan DD-metalloendopeptidase family protein [Actinomycetota bacterium]
MTVRRAHIATGLAASLLLATLVSVPVFADTASELKAARERLAVVQAQLDRLAGQYAAAQTRYAQTQDRIDQVHVRIQRVRARMGRIQAALGARAREAYESGGISTVELLLSSSSFSQFSDRVEYLGSLAKGDSNLLIQASVTGEQLRRAQSDLTDLSRTQAATVASLSRNKADIARKLQEARALEAKLADRLARERAAAAAAARARAEAARRAIGGAGLQACPVGQPRTYYDDFGDPRPGGRRHQGIDLLAPLGTPIYAAQPGRFEQNYNDLGGTSALVYGDSGDYTYYAHMSSYAGVPNGAHVAAGTMIGHVGNSGDARGGPYHLHFEYHPGGGAAVDPYRLLKAVCG